MSSARSHQATTPSGDTDSPTTLRELHAAAVAAMAERGLSLDSVDRLSDLMRRFSSYAERGCGIGLASEVTRDVAEGFVRARSKKGTPPAVGTMHFRRSAVRLEFLEGRRLGLVDHDPTLDIVLPPRSSLRARPLTDDEVTLCRSYSIHTLVETRAAAAWAVAEATAKSGELARVRVCDLDLGAARVWIAGSSKTDPRWAWCPTGEPSNSSAECVRSETFTQLPRSSAPRPGAA